MRGPFFQPCLANGSHHAKNCLGVSCASFVTLGMKWACTSCWEMVRCVPHAKKCRWNTGCGVAGLLVVVALVLIRTNFDVCWSSLSHLFFL